MAHQSEGITVEVELAAFESATGELARLRQPTAVDLAKRLEYRSDHGVPAVKRWNAPLLPAGGAD